MRFALTLFTALMVVSPAFAEAIWGYYANARYGYELDIPPGFEGQGESPNGDGQIFLFDGRVGKLTASAGHFVTEPSFESEANALFASDTEAGWGVTAQSATPSWATWSATKSGRVLQQHMIQLCDGSGYAAIRLEYAQTDRPKLDDLVQPLIVSLKSIC